MNKLDGELFPFAKILELYTNEKSVFLDKTACIFGTTIVPVNKTMPCNTEIQR